MICVAEHQNDDELLVDLNSVSISDYLYMLGNQAYEAAELLAKQVEKANATLSHLRNISALAEDAGQLIASSDLEPNAHAYPPKNTGLVREYPKPISAKYRISTPTLADYTTTIPYLDN